MDPKKAVSHQLIKMVILVILLIGGVAAYIKMNHDYEVNFINEVSQP